MMISGRPRDEQTRLVILAATLEIAQQNGYAAVTFKSVAERAEVGRQTIYRWWSSKGELVLDALVEFANVSLQPPRSNDPWKDLQTFLMTTFAAGESSLPSALIGVLVDAQHDPVLMNQTQERLLAHRRNVLTEILKDAAGRRKSGQPSPAMVAEIIFATMWYRLLSQHAPVDRKLAKELTEVARQLLD